MVARSAWPIALALTCVAISAQLLRGAKPAPEVAVGKALFMRQWEPGQAAAPGGDGLGPMHNDVSCVACHGQGGAGGAGPIEKNVSVLSLGPRPPGISRRAFQKAAFGIHPSFGSDSREVTTNIILHKLSVDPAYIAARRRLVGPDLPLNLEYEYRQQAERQLADQPVRRVATTRPVTLQLSQRNSPALFGAGLIDAIPVRLLRSLAKRQTEKGVVSGRISLVGSRVGRFGWKGQSASLADFVRGACAGELGLQVPGEDQAAHAMRNEYTAPGLDLNHDQLRALTRFVASLPAPRAAMPRDENLAQVARRGRNLFFRVGCAECHIESLGHSQRGGVQGIYSDLLIHDMGPSLADPVLAQPELITSNGSTVSSSGPAPASYYGGGSPSLTSNILPTNRDREWRTPPLWGVRDSAPYLHDGRATTLMQAILYHGGEAKPILARFLSLAPPDRLAIVEFLHTLVAPASDET